MLTEGSQKTVGKAAAALNPNWASLQEKLKTHRNPKPLTNSASLENGTPATSALGKRKEKPESEPAVPLSNLSILVPTSEDFSLTEALAMDCEMVGVSSEGNKSALGRVTLVNTWGNVVYDEYVRPIEYVVDFRTKISGIRPRNLKKAKEFLIVQKKVAELIKGRILVGHALHNDLKIEDARAAMQIYKKHKKEWEKIFIKQFRLNQKRKNKHRKKSVLEQTTKTS